MKLSEEQYDIIDAYLTNELSADDRASFEGDIQSDTKLRAEVERQRNLRLGLRALGIERALVSAKAHYQATALPEGVSPEMQSVTVRPLVRPLTIWRYWAAVASIVLLLGAGYYFFRQQVMQRDEIAYAESFDPASSDQAMKGFPTNAFPSAVRVQLLDAFRNYKAGRYDRVINQLKTLPTDRQTIYYKNYFLGLSYLANRQPTEALPLLDSARMAPGLALRQKATWFLALAYVKDGQKNKALPMLKQISIDKANPFNALAQRVLQKINQTID
jgi:hypothetical protein